MKSYPMMQVDAFTSTPLAGNPCAVIFESDGLDVEMMQAIALEMNLSETAFVRRSDVGDVGVRYFTPQEEIPLAGHPTIATAHALVASGRLKLRGEVTAVTFELQVGPIQVDIHAKNGQSGRIVMTQKKPRFLSIHNPAEVLPLFNLTPDDLMPDVPIQTVSTGTPQLMIPVRNLDALRHVQLDLAAYRAYRAASDYFSPHLFCLQGVTPAGQTFARHVDSSEDPFTGSATGGMAAYLWHYGLLPEPIFVAEQGHWMKRPGQALVEVVGPRDDIQTVKVGGTAVTVMRGEIMLGIRA